MIRLSENSWHYGKTTDMRHKFQWEDTATMIKDAEFLAYCATHPKY